MNTFKRVCIVIPMYNEENVARKTLATLVPYCKRLPGDVRVVVVDDGSSDATRQIVEQFVQATVDGCVVLCRHEQNQGYGAALRTGIAHAITHEYDYVLFMDSDLTNHPRYLVDFWKKMEEGYDYIKASRYVSGGKVEGVSWKRQIISRIGNVIARPAFQIPISDITNGFRAVKVSVLSQMVLTEHKFPIILEELWQAKRYAKTFSEIPYTLTSRVSAQGESSFAYDWRTYRTYLRYVWKALCTRRV